MRNAHSIASPDTYPPSMMDPAPKASRRVELTARAILFEAARRISVADLELKDPDDDEVVIDVEWSGVSTGTERLLWSGEMPPFPGLGYPLVPGYEAIGTVAYSPGDGSIEGTRVFAPGSKGFKGAHGLFGASASRIIVKRDRVTEIALREPEQGVLLALAATAYHALAGGPPPDLIIGNGVLGRLLARLTVASGANPPNVWEISPERCDSDGFAVLDPEVDGRSDYRSIYDVSGDSSGLDNLISRLSRGGEIVLAGFYSSRLSFDFAPAFMKEARMRVAAEWRPSDLDAVLRLIESGAFSLDGLITHTVDAEDAAGAYRTAFEDPRCLKMVLDWRRLHERAL